jgi:hypothetical protein
MEDDDFLLVDKHHTLNVYLNLTNREVHDS